MVSLLHTSQSRTSNLYNLNIGWVDVMIGKRLSQTLYIHLHPDNLSEFQRCRLHLAIIEGQLIFRYEIRCLFVGGLTILQ